jgi:signal transduction histidine kinase
MKPAPQNSGLGLPELAETLQAQNKELEIYASMVAHDLKDPLTVMIVTSDLISDVPDLTRKELKEYLQQIRYSAYDMNRIIDNLLLFAEVSKAQAPVEHPQAFGLYDQGTPGPDRVARSLAGCLRLRPMDRRSLGQLPEQCHQAWRPASARGTGRCIPAGRHGTLLDT